MYSNLSYNDNFITVQNNEEDQSCNLEIGSTNRGCTSPSGKARSSSSVENLGTSSGTEYLITDKSEVGHSTFLVKFQFLAQYRYHNISGIELTSLLSSAFNRCIDFPGYH